jgi:CheY-like chemotaxis protein
MTADQSIRLVTAIAGLLGVLIWPALVVFLAVRFRAPLSDFFGNLAELSLKAPGLEATARRRFEAAAALGAAIAKETSGGPTSFSAVADVLTEAVPDRRTQRRLQGRHVLWVDDRPNNNRYERQALEAFGVRFALSLSTDDALDQLRHQTFDLIISDMGRPPDAQAGYTLLDKLRAAGDQTPFVIYASSRSIEHVSEARRRGAQGCTNFPQELFTIVSRILGPTHLGR